MTTPPPTPATASFPSPTLPAPLSPDELIRSFCSDQRRLLSSELRSELDEEDRAGRAEESDGGVGTKPASRPPRLGHNSGNGDGDGGGDGGRRSRNALGGLRVSGLSTGLYGRTVAELTPASDSSPLLPAHRITVGDEVEVLSRGAGGGDGGGKRKKKNPGGVVCAVTDSSISVALFDGRRARGGVAAGKNAAGKTGGGRDNGDGDADDDDGLPGMNPPLSLIPRSSAEVHRKMMSAIEDLERHGTDHPLAGRLIRAAFSKPRGADEGAGGAKSTAGVSGGGEKEITFDPNLDLSQLDAVRFALSDDGGRPISLIHGPPGTGKTTTLVELVRRAVFQKGWRVLVCAPSNVAVDNVLERLVSDIGRVPPSSGGRTKRGGDGGKKIRAVRLGHPARIRPAILRHSLESLVRNADGTEIVRDVRREMDSYLRVLSDGKSRPSDRRVAKREVWALRKEIRTREEKVVRELLGRAQVVLATNVGAASRVLDRAMGAAAQQGGSGKDFFDLVVIDEAAQSLEASCWIPLLRCGRKAVLAGDHKQLPPTVLSRDGAVRKGLGQTLFERLMTMYGDDKSEKGQVSRMLTVQYRMHRDISDWSSAAMYSGRLISHESVSERKLADLPSVDEASEDAGPTLLLIDTAGCGMHEGTTGAGSRFNEGEARILQRHVTSLLQSGLKAEDVAVITPYNGQVELLRSLLLPDHPRLEIRSVDGFQGGEREAVVMSLVRSSEGGNGGGPRGKKSGVAATDRIGFLRDDRRTNVAVTRARRQCAVICDSETVSQSKFLRELLDWLMEKGEVRSAAEYECSDGAGHPHGPEPAAMDSGSVPETTTATSTKRSPGSAAAVLVEESDVAPLDASDTVGRSVLSPPRRKDPIPSVSGEERRRAIMDRVATFAGVANAKGSKDLHVGGSNLSKYDRLVIKELAVQLGLRYSEEKAGGLNMRVTVSRTEDTKEQRPPPRMSDKNDSNRTQTSAVRFAALSLQDGDDSSDSDSRLVDRGDRKITNAVLGDLAAERRRRQEEATLASKSTADAGSSGGGGGGGRSKKKKKAGSGKKKAGRTVTATPQLKCAADYDIGEDQDDDMAFLNAQIQSVQTSHGRRVQGSGNSYKSIINGVLLAKPPPLEVKRDDKATAMLRAKLKEAEQGRKTKDSGRKKR